MAEWFSRLVRCETLADWPCASCAQGVSLYAAIGDRLVPVARSADGATYQVSWTEEVAKATTGDHAIGLYDDVGYTAVRKVGAPTE